MTLVFTTSPDGRAAQAIEPMASEVTVDYSSASFLPEFERAAGAVARMRTDPMIAAATAAAATRAPPTAGDGADAAPTADASAK